MGMKNDNHSHPTAEIGHQKQPLVENLFSKGKGLEKTFSTRDN